MEHKANTRNNVIWNMMGSVFESALNFVLLIAVNRLTGEASGGVYTLAFSHAQLMYYLGTLEVRPLHSTDVEQKYSFADYFSLRTVCCAGMFLVCLVYALLMDADPAKKRVVMLICVYKMLDAFYDVFACMFQQHDRLEYSGKASVARIGLVLAVSIFLLARTRSLEAASAGMVLSSLFVLLTVNLAFWRKFPDAPIRFRFLHAREIALASFPLFVSVFVMLYISNAPKYAIDTYCSDVIQNRYSILFMPAFVINLFSQFILRPMLTPMARLWNENRTDVFRRNILRMLAGLAALTVLAMGGAYLLGIPFLELLYHVSLSGDKGILLCVMLYGGLNAVNIFLYDMIAVTRSQKMLMGAYLISAVLVFFLAPQLVRSHEMAGAIGASIAALGTLDLMLLAIIFRVMGKKAGAAPGAEA